MDICYICVIASVSTKAVTGMRIENSERGYVTFMTDPWLGQSTIIYKGMQYQAS
jgi:hypothetical protein